MFRFKGKNIQSLIAFTGVVCILSLQFRIVFPFIDYTLNKEYVQKVLCINKSRPQLHCNGKCILSLRIQKAFDEEQTDSTPLPQPVKIKIPSLEIIENTSESFFLLKKPSYTQFLFSEVALSQYVSPPVCPPPQRLA
ncbi:MAG: hypothetical protein SF052_17390 [Bacteroidia bacterium]|nr:hypothetical protein [Bacteroidia bacterium]